MLTVFLLVQNQGRDGLSRTKIDLTTDQSVNSPGNKAEPSKLAPPDMIIDQKKNYSALLQTTEGKVQIALNVQETPITVNNFVYLARQKFYDQTVFHRVIKGFMIQGGDPLGNGTGGPGYRFDDEPFTGEYTRGTVAMANSGPNTNGSQFFIVQEDTSLPKNYVIFGKVTKGMNVVDKIASTTVEAGASGEVSSPVKSVVIQKVHIIEE